MWYWGLYEVNPSESHIHEAYTVIFTGYEEELYADSEEEAHEIAIEFLLRQGSK